MSHDHKAVTTTPIAPCKGLEIGCGTGDNAIWLSQQKFVVIGIDASEIAIDKAREARANVTCPFAALNILKGVVEGSPSLKGRHSVLPLTGAVSILWILPVNGRPFAEQVNRHLAENGLWLSLIGNADEKRLGPGPPQPVCRRHY